MYERFSQRNLYYLIILTYPVRTQRRFNVHTMSCQRSGRCIDVETTLCACVQGKHLLYL